MASTTNTAYTGDDVDVVVNIKNADGTAYTDLNTNDTIRAALISQTDGIIGNVIVCNSGWTGANWPNGAVAVKFPKADTALWSNSGYYIEVSKVDFTTAERLTFRTDDKLTVNTGFINATL